jgi:hypothetical protein
VMARMTAIALQASAVETALRIISGAQSAKPSAKERDYLVASLKDAGTTLRWIEMNEAKIRAAIVRAE